MNQDLQEYRSGKKSLELGCYAAGAGAFGVFLRWLQAQLAFNELGLPDRSFLHVVLLFFVLAAAVVFIVFTERFRRDRMYVSDLFPEAFENQGKGYTAARIAAGLLVLAGAALLFMQSELDKNSTDYRTLAVMGMLAGIAFPVWLGAANRNMPENPRFLCVLSFIPMLFCAAWVVICYKMNTINSVIWSYILELGSVAAAMFAFFRLGGFVFGRPDWRRCLFNCLFAAMLCIMCLADERYLGQQVMFLGLAAELILCSWILVKNMLKGEAPVKRKKNTGGFEEL